MSLERVPRTLAGKSYLVSEPEPTYLAAAPVVVGVGSGGVGVWEWDSDPFHAQNPKSLGGPPLLQLDYLLLELEPESMSMSMGMSMLTLLLMLVAGLRGATAVKS